MKTRSLRLFWLFLCLTALAPGQTLPFVDSVASDLAGHPVSLPSTSHGTFELVVTASAPLPRLAPGPALQALGRRSLLQSVQLASYSATMLIRAQMPDISQSGEYELQKHYSAPRTLIFKALRFTGDSFIKHVILRLLASEVEHLEKDDLVLTAITSTNYKVSYSKISQLDGRAIYVYQVKPRHRRKGLFKGRIYLDAYTGSLVRDEGRLVKSPSFFVRKIDFIEDFADIDSFTLPLHIHLEAQARFVGHTTVDIYQGDYQTAPTELSAEGLGTF